MIEELLKKEFCKEHGLNPDEVKLEITPDGIEVTVIPLPQTKHIKTAPTTGEEERQMNIKDFKPGQEVFTLSTIRGRTTHYVIRKCVVKSVGRKYVKISTEDSLAWTAEFYKHEYDNGNYLTENKNWGDRMKLFASMQAANDEIEREALKRWFSDATKTWKIQNYTLEQLRAVKDILGGKENGKEKEV